MLEYIKSLLWECFIIFSIYIIWPCYHYYVCVKVFIKRLYRRFTHKKTRNEILEELMKNNEFNIDKTKAD